MQKTYCPYMIVDDETLSCCSYNCWLRSEGGTVVEWSWRWTCNAVVPGSSLISSVTLIHSQLIQLLPGSWDCCCCSVRSANRRHYGRVVRALYFNVVAPCSNQLCSGYQLELLLGSPEVNSSVMLVNSQLCPLLVNSFSSYTHCTAYSLVGCTSMRKFGYLI